MTNQQPTTDDIQHALAEHADRIVAALMAHPVTGNILGDAPDLNRRRCAATCDQFEVR